MVFGLFSGPGIGFLLLGVAFLWSLVYDNPTLPLVVLHISEAWLLTSIAILAIYSLLLGKSASRRLGWCHREHQQKRDWKGGTSECLILSSLLRDGPEIARKDWKRFWSTHSQSPPRP